MRGRLPVLALLGVAAVLLPGHSPYKQWYAYRAKHLVVVVDEGRPGAFEAAVAVASAVAARWPESKAVPALARTPRDVVSLLVTGQLQVGLLSSADAADAAAGRGKFAGTAKVPLRAVAIVGSDVLVVLESYAPERAALIARAVVESGAAGKASSSSPIPFHRGALEFYGRRSGD
ncbi:MAG TPA: hypothetical protein VFA79_13905 [Myxococcales bacterium]|nr:hypothetical protein [Myxococcales bacterium]